MSQEVKTPPIISIVVPVYNEQQLIPELYRRINQAIEIFPNRYQYEVIFVNDGSKDKSIKLLLAIESTDPKVKIIDFSRNFGHQRAITAGIDYASGEAVVVMDGDLQDPPEVIKDFIQKWEEGFEVVYGVRKKRNGETAFKLATAKIFYRLLSSIAEVDIPLDAGDFRLIDRKVADQLRLIREESRYIRGLISWMGFRQTGVEYKRDKRYAGKTKYTLRKMLRFALDGLTSFSEKPLILASYAGAVVAVFAVFWGGWIILSRVLGISDSIIGWSSLMVTILFLGGAQLCTIGILGQYLGRVYRQGKQRPLYIVGDFYGFEGRQVACDCSYPTLQSRKVYIAHDQFSPGTKL